MYQKNHKYEIGTWVETEFMNMYVTSIKKKLKAVIVEVSFKDKFIFYTVKTPFKDVYDSTMVSEEEIVTCDPPTREELLGDLNV